MKVREGKDDDGNRKDGGGEGKELSGVTILIDTLRGICCIREKKKTAVGFCVRGRARRWDVAAITVNETRGFKRTAVWKKNCSLVHGD